jgi:hypothetical protein
MNGDEPSSTFPVDLNLLDREVFSYLKLQPNPTLITVKEIRNFLESKFHVDQGTFKQKNYKQQIEKSASRFYTMLKTLASKPTRIRIPETNIVRNNNSFQETIAVASQEAINTRINTEEGSVSGKFTKLENQKMMEIIKNYAENKNISLMELCPYFRVNPDNDAQSYRSGKKYSDLWKYLEDSFSYRKPKVRYIF